MSFKRPHCPQLSPYLTVKDAEKAIKFYQQAFGFELIDAARDEKGAISHVEMKKGDAMLMFCPEGAFGAPKKSPVTSGITMPLNFYVYCENTDQLYEQALKCNAKSVMAPNDGFWGDRFCVVLDPDGYEWGFATYLGR